MGTGLDMRRATCMAVDPGTGTCSIALTGDLGQADSCKVLPVFWPTVGESVWVLKTGSDQVVVGSAMPIASPLRSRLSVDQPSIAAQTTLQSVTGLALTPTPNVPYELEGCIIYISPVAADMKFAFTFPVAWQQFFVWTGGGVDVNASAGHSDLASNAAQYQPPDFTFSYGGSDSFVSALQIKGFLDMPATPGTLTPRYAQATSNAGTTQIFKYSWLRLTRA